MTVIRAVKDRFHYYVQVSKKSHEDINLSFQAFGFLTYCLGKKDDWRFYVTQVAKERKIGIKKVNSCLNELVDNGYAIRWQPRNEKGDFLPAEIIVSDSKEEIERLKAELVNDTSIKKMFTKSRLGKTRKGISLKAPLTTNDCLESNDASETTITPQPKSVKMDDENNSCCCSDDPEFEFELKMQLFDDNEIPENIARLYVDFPLEQVKNAIEACKQYAEKNSIANIKGLLRKAIDEAWVPNQSKAQMEKYIETQKVIKSDKAEKIKKQCEDLLKSYERIFTKESYFALSDNAITLVGSLGTSVIGYLEKDAMIILEYFIEHQLKSRLKPS